MHETMVRMRWTGWPSKSDVVRVICLVVIFMLLFPVKSRQASAQQIRRVAPKQNISLTRAQSNYIRRTMKPSEIKELSGIGITLASNPSFRAVKERWEGLIASVAKRGIPLDIHAFVQWVLRETYLVQNRILMDYADKVKHYNELKREMRDELKRARAQRNNWRPSSTFTPRPPEPLAVKRTVPMRITTSKNLSDYIGQLEAEMATAGDDAQLANIDLQNQLQKQQQLVQILSQVSKMLHDTAMSIVRKIG